MLFSSSDLRLVHLILREFPREQIVMISMCSYVSTTTVVVVEVSGFYSISLCCVFPPKKKKAKYQVARAADFFPIIFSEKKPLRSNFRRGPSGSTEL